MMKRSTTLAAVLGLCALAAAPALAQQPQSPPPAPSPNTADCMARTPQKIEGQVTSVDPNGGKVTVRDSRGQTHEFQASRETLATMKPGDRVDATLRQAPKC
jgi:hypothetical protein